MKKTINPSISRLSINFIDDIPYSKVRDLNGNEMTLRLSIMAQNGNSEMKIVSNIDDTKDNRPLKPAIIWIPGGGYRGCDKNLMVSEMQFLAEEGYVIASIYYRSSAEGKAPAQIEDVKTAIRFLRANASDYDIDPDKIGVVGRSAGGHLATLAATNSDDFITNEWQGFSSKVQACYDMFGPCDFDFLYDYEDAKCKLPNSRWNNICYTHLGAVIGGTEKGLKERAKIYNTKSYINQQTSPILITHGTADELVPIKVSELLYEALCDFGLEEQTYFYEIEGAGHGTDEFFQDETKIIALKFFDKYLK